jgi:cytochrome c-type biogenesis protein CcmH
MQRQHKIILFFTCLLVFILPGRGISSSAEKPGAKNAEREIMMEITRGMVCLCGCGNQILATCACGEAQKEREYVLSLVKMGKSREEIVAAMVKMKGTQVLAAPEKKGLNWILWVVVPYILPVVAVAMVGYILLGWVRKKRRAAPEAPASKEPSPEEDEYMQKLKQELDEFS